jgi:Icc protein
MQKRWYHLIGLILLFISCRFNYSPFIVPNYKQKLNQKNLTKILDGPFENEGSIRIALISDVHNYYDEFNDQINQLNKSGPYDFVIIAGDVTNLGLWEEFEQIRIMLKKLKYPFLVAIGNHDSLSNGREIYKRLFGESEFQFDLKNTQFIFINNNNWETPGTIPNKENIENLFQESTQKYKIVIGHIPFDDRERFTDIEIQDWKNFLESNNVNYFINGHNHAPAEQKWEHFTQLTIGSPTQKGLMEIIINEENITHHWIDY